MIGLLGLAACAAPGGSAPTPTPKPQAVPDAKPGGQAAKPAAGSSPSPIAGGAGGPGKQWSSAPAMAVDQARRYVATIDTTAGELQADLFVKDAPNTVNNFVFLAREGFYDGVPFHRIIRGFMVQTGDPTGTGRGGPGYRFNDELPRTLEYEKGTLAMANAGPNTQGSQFFICHDDLRGKLPKNYTIFGKLTSGLDVLDRIASTPVRAGPGGEPSQPTQDVRITSVTIQES
jgi:peptidylprolyl isomerase